MPERDPDLTLLIETARAAGEIAQHYFKADPDVWDKGHGQGPVTEADLHVNRQLEADLRSARGGYGWLSEETEDDTTRLRTDRQFIVDPIDGTRAFIEGAKDWAHSLAVAEAGQVVAAVVFLPERNALYAATAGAGATLNGAPITVSDTATLEEATVLAARPTLDAANWKGAVPPFKRVFRSSLAYRLSAVAEGRFDAMVTLRPTWEWDVAAGSLIVAEATGTATDRTGAALRFNNPHPQVDGIVAAGQVHHGLIAALA